jgi:hypothetical protein
MIPESLLNGAKLWSTDDNLKKDVRLIYRLSRIIFGTSPNLIIELSFGR